MIISCYTSLAKLKIDSMRFDKVISVCAKKDIEVWKVASAQIIRKINSNKYIVIVPSSQISLFQSASPSEYEVIDENRYTEKFLPRLLVHGDNSKSSIAWYIQQFLKLSELSEIGEDEIALIWDADTIPLREIEFKKNGRIVLYKGSEYHEPYFETIRKLLNCEKQNNYSYIAQCIPCKGRWIKSLIGSIEKSGTPWQIAILNSIDFSKASSFSEYETLGTFIENNFCDEIEITNRRWQRYGNGLIGGPKNLRYFSKIFAIRYDFMSFEAWDKPYSYYKKRFASIIRMQKS